MIVIYSIPSYNECYLDKCLPICDTIENILHLLENDKHYHERIDSDMPVIFNIDLDKLIDFETFQNNLILYFKLLNIDVFQNDFCYTQNFGKTLPSYHFTIPKYYATSKILKLFWNNFKIKYNYGSEIDTGHLGTKGKWFRLPQQAKEGVKGTEHVIIKGYMIDFILQHIPTHSILLDDKINTFCNQPHTKYKSDNKCHTNIIPAQIIKSETNKEIIELLQLIHPSRFDDYNKWSKIGMIIYSIYPNKKEGLLLWDELSKQSSKYKKGMCAEKYRTFHKQLYTIRSLHYFARLDNPNIYHSTFINKQFVEPDEFFISITVNKRYLTMDNTVLNLFDSFYLNDSLKCFSIKSPMDTGKSSFIMSILDKYQPKKVLFLSFRKSLTYNIQSRLQNYGFQSYLEHYYDADKLIIQIESLLKIIENNHELKIDTYRTLIPSYDIIIIDEIISILNQFSSPTFKGTSKDVFEFLELLLSNSHKIIALDADYSIRSHDFLTNILGENSVYTIYNQFVNNQRTLVFTESKELFDRHINNSLMENKKIVIVSMTSSDAEYYQHTIKQFYPDKNTFIYIGDTDDLIKKEHFLNINFYWKNADVVIYSATIEAGVDFNEIHFDQMYCILQSDVSSSQRSLLQMLFRVRQLKNQHILVLNKDHLPIHQSHFWTFDDVLDGLTHTCNSVLQYTYLSQPDQKQIIRTKFVSNYSKCQVYNKVELLNKNRIYFLPVLIYLAKQKGYNILFNQQIPEHCNISIFHKKNAHMKINSIIESDDINDHTYSLLIEKQKNGSATQLDKLIITKHYYKQKLGVDFLDYHIMNIFYKKEHLIDNFIYLINSNYIPSYNDEHTQQLRMQIKIVSTLLNDLGFNSVLSQDTYEHHTFQRALSNTIENHFIFKKQIQCRALFGLPKKNLSLENNNNNIFKYINTILSQFGVQLICSKPIGKRKRATNFIYSISILHGINELITYKMNKDSQLRLDNIGPINNYHYTHLLSNK